MASENTLPNFLKNFKPWQQRFSRKYRVELVHRMNEVLLEKGITQAKLAKLAGWKEAYVSRILGGEQNLTLKTVARFEEAVDSDILEIPLPTTILGRPVRSTSTKKVWSDKGSRIPLVDIQGVFAGVEAEREKFSSELRHCIWTQESRSTQELELSDVS